MAGAHDEKLHQVLARIGRFLEAYAKPTMAERQEARLTADPLELAEFHRIMSEELEGILAVLDQYPPDGVPHEWQPVANACLFLAECDSPVVKWLPRYKLPEVPDALDPRHFEFKDGYYDQLVAREKTRLSRRMVRR